MIIHDDEELISCFTCSYACCDEDTFPIDLSKNKLILEPIMHSLQNDINVVIESEGIYVFRLLVSKLK